MGSSSEWEFYPPQSLPSTATGGQSDAGESQINTCASEQSLVALPGTPEASKGENCPTLVLKIEHHHHYYGGNGAAQQPNQTNSQQHCPTCTCQLRDGFPKQSEELNRHSTKRSSCDQEVEGQARPLLKRSRASLHLQCYSSDDE